MTGLQLLAPECLLATLALILLLADLAIPPRHGRILFHIGVACAALTLGMLGLSHADPGRFQGIGTLWVVDPMSLFFKALILATTIVALLLTLDYSPEPGTSAGRLGTFTALVLLAAVGLMLLVSATDLLLVFLSLELVSISSFLLTGYEYRSRKSSEGAMKYFLIGAFSSAVMVYGISLFYGATGTTSLVGLAHAPSPALLLGALMLVVGFGFKASVAPFHLWVPDAYEGAPTPITAFLSIAPKVAALAAMLRVFLVLLPEAGFSFTTLFAVLAALTMTVGNLTAIFQNNVKRLLAYSSIAQAGYILIGIASGSPMGRDAVLLYSLVYFFMNLGAFAVAIMVGNEESYELESFDGLSERSFPTALLMAFFLLSLAGIPPMAGFIAKFYIFAAAVESKLYWLAVVGLLNSVASVYYYLRIVYHMFFMPARREAPLDAGFFLRVGVLVAALGVIGIGLWPDPFILSARASASTLPEKPASITVIETLK